MTAKSTIPTLKCLFVATYYNKKYLQKPKVTPKKPIDSWDVSHVTDMSNLFNGFEKFNEPLNNWNVSNVTNMNRMFKGCCRFNKTLAKWDTSKVKSMIKMFAYCVSFKNASLAKWNVDNVLMSEVEQEQMFQDVTLEKEKRPTFVLKRLHDIIYKYEDEKLAELYKGIDQTNIKYLVDCYIVKQDRYKLPLELREKPIGEWDVSHVTDMYKLFFGEKFENFNELLNDWDVSNVTNMNRMFSGCKKYNQPLSKWNTSNVVDMNRMFSGCKKFNQPLSNWNTSNVVDMVGMFEDCEKFNQDLSNWNVDNINMDSLMDTFENFKKKNIPKKNIPKKNIPKRAIEPPIQKPKQKRCPNGTRKNKQGDCVAKTEPKKSSPEPKPKKKRCPNGTRKNKQGDCVAKT